MKSKKNPFSGVIGGIVLLVLGTGLLWWNEGNNVKNLQSVNEGLKNYTDIKRIKC